jgi:hypothetical protein
MADANSLLVIGEVGHFASGTASACPGSRPRVKPCKAQIHIASSKANVAAISKGQNPLEDGYMHVTG